jgi:hypothetical protein
MAVLHAWRLGPDGGGGTEWPRSHAWRLGPDGGWVTGQVLSRNGGVVLGR